MTDNTKAIRKKQKTNNVPQNTIQKTTKNLATETPQKNKKKIHWGRILVLLKGNSSFSTSGTCRVTVNRHEHFFNITPIKTFSWDNRMIIYKKNQHEYQFLVECHFNLFIKSAVNNIYS